MREYSYPKARGPQEEEDPLNNNGSMVNVDSMLGVKGNARNRRKSAGNLRAQDARNTMTANRNSTLSQYL